ncbi:hypothetical protein NMY22_g1465 [Coprinellus aureogranulatus]|nr:hypothetical protein NMY22_g1465 [Coprinellus aureogranulatus]
MSQQDALEACKKADLQALSSLLSNKALEINDQLISDLLVAAITVKAEEIVRWLLTSYNIPRLDPKVFFNTASNGTIGILDLLHAKYPTILTDLFERHGSGTLLGLALSAARNKPFIEHLLDLGSDPKGDDEAFCTPLRIAASSYEDPDMLEFLLERGAVIQGSSALANAVDFGRTANVKYLLARGADINDPGRKYLPFFALHAAVEKSDTEMVRFLLTESPKKADLSLVDGRGRTIWDLARAEGGKREILLLLEAAQNREGL